MMGNRVSELSDFTGGMNTLVASHLISDRESTVLVNVDIRLGSLASMPKLEFKDTLSGGFFFEFNGINSYVNYRDNVIWDSKWYWSDGLETKKMLADGTVMDLGIKTPDTPVDLNEVLDESGMIYQGVATVAEINAMDELDMVEDYSWKMTDYGTITLGDADVYVSVNDYIQWQTAGFTNIGNVGGPHTGVFKYCYTFYSSDTNVESAPSPLQNEYITVEGSSIMLTNMEALPSNADTYRIYRIGGYLPQFTLVDTTDTNSYLDELGDTRIDGRLLQTMYCGLPPEGLVNLLEMNGRFYGSVGNKIYYSALGNPDAWYISDYFLAREHIRGLSASPGGLLAMGRYFTLMFYGTQPSDYRVRLLSDQIGCVDRKSISFIGNSAIWLSHRSFVMCNGYEVTDITAHKIDYLTGIIPTGAVVDDNTYHMSFGPQLVPSETLYPEDDLYPNLVEGTSGLDDGIIVMDFKRGNGFSYKLVNYNNITSLGIVKGEVYVATDENSTFNVSRLAVYNGQGLTDLTYLSPRLDDGSYATLKEYEKVRILYTGTFDVQVLFGGGEVVVEKTLPQSDDPDTFAIIGIPNKRNKSHYIRFAITGVGVIYSIQYSWKPREQIG